MPQTDISSATASDLANTMKDFAVSSEVTDGPADQKETEYINNDWPDQFGYYTNIPELQAVIDAKATWTVGKGFKADEITTMLLDTIKGFGKDTFNTILENMLRTMHISGDSFAEIIRDGEDNLINLKTLDPSTIKIIANNKGIIIRYEQIAKVGKEKGKVVKNFKPDKLFHLARNRVADQIHGTSMVDVLVNTILRINEAKDDWKRVLHHNIDPMIAYKLDTDDETKIKEFKAKVDAAKGKGENMYIPKDTVEFEIISLAPNANLSPIAWIEAETDKFYQMSGVPRFVVGGLGGITEAAVKIGYLAYQQNIEEDQLYVEESVLSQLNLVIELEFPASLENELLSDNKKDETNGAAQPNEVQA